MLFLPSFSLNRSCCLRTKNEMRKKRERRRQRFALTGSLRAAKRLDVGLGKSVDEVALDDERAQSASGGDRVSQRLPEMLEIGESVQARTNPKLGQRRPATVATSLPKTAEKRAGCVPKLCLKGEYSGAFEDFSSDTCR